MNTDFLNQYPYMNGKNLAYFVFIRETVDMILNTNHNLSPEEEVFLAAIKDSANRGAEYNQECWSIYRQKPKPKEDINDKQTQYNLGIKPKEKT